MQTQKHCTGTLVDEPRETLKMLIIITNNYITRIELISIFHIIEDFKVF